MKKQTTDPLRLTCLVVAGVFSFLLPTQGQDSLADLPSFQAGCTALEKKDFATGATAFQKTWDIISKGDAGDTGLNLVATRLLESFVNDGENTQAVAWFDKNKDQFQPNLSSNFWIARALQNEEQFSEAARRYSGIIKASSSPSREIILNYVWCLARSGKPGEALEALNAAFPTEDDQDRIFRAQMAYDAGLTTRARDYLDPVFAETSRLSPAWQFRAYRLRAHILSKQGKRVVAVSEILSRIDSLDRVDEIYRTFDLLREIARPANYSSITKQLEGWMEADDSLPDLKISAEYASILISGPRAKRLKVFIENHRDHPLAQEAELALLKLKPSDLIPPEPNLAGRFRFIKATQLFQKKSFQQAVKEFQTSAASQKGEERQRSLYNAAVAALYSDDEPLFEKIQDQLISFDENASGIGNLLYLSGLHYASKADSRAFELLNKFVLKFPEHPSRIDAELALAEIHLNQVPPHPQSAREVFSRLRQRPLTLEQNERLDYTAVWTELIAGNQIQLIALADKFLEDWPNSDSQAEISMLLGSAYYRSGEQVNARKMFLQTALEHPRSEFAAPARFFAAKTSPPTEEALSEWDAIIDQNGPLSQFALHEKGLLLLVMNRHGEARDVFNEVIEKEKPESQLRFAAMSDLGFAWYMEALANDRDKVMLRMAANVFGQISRLPNASRAWRFQGAVRRAKCIEALGNLSVALEIYNSIVAESDKLEIYDSMVTESGNSPPYFEAYSPVQENEWRYRAGFSAIALLESKSDWLGAIKVADALSRKNGPRAIEAARHADLLRLKHWVWE